MTESTIYLLLTSAVSIAFLHTLLGVDHYLPFVLIGKARKWKLRQTLSLTALCGLGHVVGSIVLGSVGIALGLALKKMEWVEGFRGSVAAWGLIAFGLMYAAWHMVQYYRGKRHTHPHIHEDGTIHTHEHDHHGAHTHVHEEAASKAKVTKWTLFIIFVFGPCEALIPLLMVPAYKHNWGVVAAVTLLFSFVTVLTMLATVTAVSYGLKFAPTQKLERHANAVAGLAIAGSGLAIQMLGI